MRAHALMLMRHTIASRQALPSPGDAQRRAIRANLLCDACQNPVTMSWVKMFGSVTWGAVGVGVGVGVGAGVGVGVGVGLGDGVGVGVGEGPPEMLELL